jgi:hypothetical protein
LFGLGWENAKNTKAATSLDQGEEDEGNAHSGPGGYEGMGYSGGYAADYFDGHESESGEH